MIATEKPAGYIVARGLNAGGRRLFGGEPAPAELETPLLIDLGWIRGVDQAELDAAIAEHGRPPAKLSFGWEFERDEVPALRRPPKKAKKKTGKKKAKKARTRRRS